MTSTIKLGNTTLKLAVMLALVRNQYASGSAIARDVGRRKTDVLRVLRKLAFVGFGPAKEIPQ